MAPKELAYPSLRFDVDTPKDLNYLTILTNYGVSITTCAISIVSIALALKTPRLVTTDICNDPDLNLVDTYFLGRWCFESLDSENAAVKGNKILPFPLGRPYKALC